jgi:uncharacterized cupredoxin-like copper-binding protein
MTRTRGAAITLAATLLLVLAAFTASAGAQAKGSTTVVVTVSKPSEFRFTLSTKTVKHGTVIFKVTNKGTTQHDFSINGKKTKLLSPKASTTLTVTFAKAGSYAYKCTVPGHAALGMKGVLKVT